MTDETKPNPTETVETEPEAKGQGAASSNTAVEDEYDRERAMNTILNLRKMEKEWKRKERELESLQKDKQAREEQDKTEAQRYKERADQLEAELKAERHGRMRMQVAAEFNLPETLANRLQGETVDELKADAAELAKLLPKKKEAPALNPTDLSDGKKGETDAQKRARIYNKGADLFDADAIRKNGGGVFFNNS